jgi:hypothetical protein
MHRTSGTRVGGGGGGRGGGGGGGGGGRDVCKTLESKRVSHRLWLGDGRKAAESKVPARLN